MEVLPVEPVDADHAQLGARRRGARRDVLQAGEHVVDPHDRAPGRRLDDPGSGGRDERDARAGRERGRDEVVTVAVAVQRDEARAGLERARVERPRRDHGVGRPGDDHAAGVPRDLGGGRRHHARASSSARATTRSSNGSVRPPTIWPGLVTLAGDDHDVAGPRAARARRGSRRAGRASRSTALPARNAGEDLGDDRGRILGAGVVGGDVTRSAARAAISPIIGRFARSRSPPQPNTAITRPPGADELARRRRAPLRARRACARSRRAP